MRIIKNALLLETNSGKTASDLDFYLSDVGISHRIKTKDMRVEYLIAESKDRCTDITPESVVTYLIYVSKKDFEKALDVLKSLDRP